MRLGARGVHEGLWRQEESGTNLASPLRVALFDNATPLQFRDEMCRVLETKSVDSQEACSLDILLLIIRKQRLLRLHPGPSQGGLEDPRVGFQHADLVGNHVAAEMAENGKVLEDINEVNAVCIGDGPEGQSPRQVQDQILRKNCIRQDDRIPRSYEIEPADGASDPAAGLLMEFLVRHGSRLEPAGQPLIQKRSAQPLASHARQGLHVRREVLQVKVDEHPPQVKIQTTRQFSHQLRDPVPSPQQPGPGFVLD